MYAVISQNAIHYLGSNKDAALSVLESKTGTMVTFKNLTELVNTFETHVKLKESKEEPSRLDEVLKRLEKIDLAGEAEDVLKKTRENGEYAIGQVRSIGLRGLKGLGEGFTAIGDLLQKAGDKEVEVIEKPEEKK